MPVLLLFALSSVDASQELFFGTVVNMSTLEYQMLLAYPYD